jgi:hypothetical protein
MAATAAARNCALWIITDFIDEILCSSNYKKSHRDAALRALALRLLLSPPRDQQTNEDDGAGHHQPALECHAKKREALYQPIAHRRTLTPEKGTIRSSRQRPILR